jgi:predicted RNA-binding Zn-ribbon protein involved in translation (DUF1610 family)
MEDTLSGLAASKEWSWHCPACSTRKQYNEQYDSYYCPNCKVWLDKKCRDPNCEFCAHRPDNP